MSSTKGPAPLSEEALLSGGDDSTLGSAPSSGANTKTHTAEPSPNDPMTSNTSNSTVPAQPTEAEDVPQATSSSEAQKMGDLQYLQSHDVHILLDKMIREVLVEKPKDAHKWMLRWFLERHRVQCEERYRHNSPQHRPNHADDPMANSGNALEGGAVFPPGRLSFDEDDTERALGEEQ